MFGKNSAEKNSQKILKLYTAYVGENDKRIRARDIRKKIEEISKKIDENEKETLLEIVKEEIYNRTSKLRESIEKYNQEILLLKKEIKHGNLRQFEKVQKKQAIERAKKRIDILSRKKAISDDFIAIIDPIITGVIIDEKEGLRTTTRRLTESYKTEKEIEELIDMHDELLEEIYEAYEEEEDEEEEEEEQKIDEETYLKEDEV